MAEGRGFHVLDTEGQDALKMQVTGKINSLWCGKWEMLKSSLQNYELVPPPQDVDDPQAVGAWALENFFLLRRVIGSLLVEMTSIRSSLKA